MGAVFTIALFSPLMIPIYILEKLGINITGIFEQVTASISGWLEANPETALKIGNAMKDVFAFIIEIAEKL